MPETAELLNLLNASRAYLAIIRESSALRDYFEETLGRNVVADISRIGMVLEDAGWRI